MVPADGAAPDWRRGWVVFVDRDGDRRPGDGEEVIMRHGPLAEGIAVDDRIFQSTGRALSCL